MARIGEIVFSTLMVSFSSTMAPADDGLTTPNVPWGESGAWSVFVDPSVGNGCLIQQLTDDDLLVQLGYLPERLGGFISVASTEWADLETGELHTITLLFDGATFAGETEFFEKGGYFGGFSFFNNPEFLSDFAKRKTLTIIGPDEDKAELDLKGTSKAISSMKACQEAQ